MSANSEPEPVTPPTSKRPSLYDNTADESVWSNLSVGGNRLTWREAAADWERQYHRAQALAQVLADLDRCEHGRHEGDDCSGCKGRSHGNPHAPTGAVIGYSLYGDHPIVQPPREKRSNPDAWYRREASDG